MATHGRQWKTVVAIGGQWLMWTLVVCGVSLTVIPAVFWAFTPLRWNVTASFPIGFYWAVETPPRTGTLVSVCLPEAVARFGWERRYIGGGICPGLYQPVLKRVEAVAGDTVEVADDYVAVNGTVIPQSATASTDSHGRLLPRIPRGTYTLKPGELWVMSTSQPHSWDSRYYGPIPIDNVRETATAWCVLWKEHGTQILGH